MLAIALTAMLLAAVAVAVIATVGSGSPGHADAGTGVPAGERTTAVARRTLTESTSVDGTLGYKGSYQLYDRLAEAGTFTWLPGVGSVIHRGGTLFRENNLPVVLMYGHVPAYRTLAKGVGNGPDVRELNRNMIDLGFDPDGRIRDRDHFGAATAAAVRRWQKSEGLPRTGRVELGRIVFAPSSQRVTKLNVTLGEDPPGTAEPPAETTGEAPTEAPAGPESSEESPSRRPSSGTPAAGSDGEGTGGGGMLVLSTTSARQVVQVELKADEQKLARVGESAPVTLPSGRVVRGRITEVGTVASEASAAGGPSGAEGEQAGNGEDATIPVTLTLKHPVAHLDEAPVSVELVESVSHDVLTVPATALTATAGGGYAIEALEGGRRVQIPVRPGMFADGYVQIEGSGIHPGLTVLESE